MFFQKKKTSGDSSPDTGSVSKKDNVHLEKAPAGTVSPPSVASGYIPPDEKELKKLMWKVDLRIIPLVALLYLFSYLDRVNIGNAKIAGLMEDVDMTESEYNWALSIFFIGYIVFEVPSNVILKKIGPRIWLSTIMVIWGTILAAMSKVKTGNHLLAARFFLGVAEAGLYPGVLFYLSVWYTRKQQATRIALFYGSSTLAGAFGGVLAYGIMHMDGLRGMRGWQWIFIIEAIPTIVLGFATYFILPDYPEKTKFLSEREREIIVNIIKVDVGPAVERHFSWKQFWDVFKDWKTFAFGVLSFAACTPMYSLSMFMPSIIRDMGFSSLRAQAMSSPPYAVACVITILNAMSADRHTERGFHIAIPSALGLIGYMLLIVCRNKGPAALYVSAIITVTGAFAESPPKTSWFSNSFGGHTKRAVALAFIIALGNIGGCIGGQVYRATDAPHYVRGHAINLSLMGVLILLSMGIKYTLYRINKKRDNMTPEEYRMACEGEELCDKHPDFRYIL
ncbi:major facilitator superfamily domain-containing protein [Fennellomyces sp. T-0311]|nr:major facilitator superfamily domain-containing protein [Fennellomyces sp. T-0311]